MQQRMRKKLDNSEIPLDRERVDRVFSEEDSNIRPFEFNENVAHVFDDMACRSIPHYQEVQKLVASLALTFFQEGSAIWDLGCSTGTTMALIAQGFKDHDITDYNIIGVDSSDAMCKEANEKLNTLAIDREKQRVVNGDLLKIEIQNPSVIIMNYTLQFVKPLMREALIKKIYDSLPHNGILLVSDKMVQSHTDVSRIFIEYYYNFKRTNGYSELEISQKREALENVLIPYSVEEELNLFKRSGFEVIDTFFSWYNFSSFICIKKEKSK